MGSGFLSRFLRQSDKPSKATPAAVSRPEARSVEDIMMDQPFDRDMITMAPLPDLPEDAFEGSLRERIIAAIKTIFDPEIPVNIYDLGLIYRLEVDDNGHVEIDMTLTSPMCPVAEILPEQVDQIIRLIEGVSEVDLNLVWEPPWHPDRLTDEVKLELGLL